MKKFFTAAALTMVLTYGATIANAGIIILGVKEEASCTATKAKVDSGIIILGLTGIIITNFTGILVGDAVETPDECGTIIDK